jgi:hypothetical protein
MTQKNQQKSLTEANLNELFNTSKEEFGIHNLFECRNINMSCEIFKCAWRLDLY